MRLQTTLQPSPTCGGVRAGEPLTTVRVASETTASLPVPPISEVTTYSDASWSPEGRSIAYLADNHALVVGDHTAAGVTNAHVITTFSDAIRDLDWSP